MDDIEIKIKKIWPSWEIKKVLGKGTYGTVFESIRSDNNVISKAAIKYISVPTDLDEIKTLQSEGLVDEEIKGYYKKITDSFVNEIQLMESFKGTQNIVSIEDYQVVENNNLGFDIFIRMELLTPFTKYIKEKNIDEAEAIKLGIDICSALEVCSKKDIIHRDIKPENIFINEYGNYKLGDFGVARKLGDINSSKSQKGTYNYIAPEILKGTHYDARVDIYSLGITLYRIMNENCMPFLNITTRLDPDERTNAFEKRLGGENMPRPTKATDAFAKVILKACAYNPEERYKSANEFKNALEEIAFGNKYENKTLQIDLDATIMVNSINKKRDNFDNGVNNKKILNEHDHRNNIGDSNNKKKSKLLIIIGVLLVLLIGIGIACVTLFGYDCEKKGHVLSDWIVTKEATCLEEGYEYIQCTKCKEVMETKTIDALGHGYSDWVSSKETTCTEDGERYQECSRCSNKITEVVARLGHQYKNGKCTVCGTVNCMGNHTASSWMISTEATCTSTGTRYQECTTCHEIIKTEVISKVAHSYGNWTIDSDSTCSVEGSKHRNCTICGYKETATIELKEHNYVSGKCSVCGAAQCSGNHTASSWIVTKEATCAETGIQVKKCTVCSEVLQQEIISMKSHISSDWIIDKEATCVSVGLKHKECTLCNTILSQETISQLTTHTYGSWIVDSDSTCSVAGSKHRNCTVCGYQETATIELKSHSYVGSKCSVCGYEIEVGNVITFGSYEQDNDISNGKEDIEWLVLAVDGNEALVISKYALDRQPYNTTYTNVTWETCTLRSWLNSTFLNTAFSSSEQAKILTTTVVAEDSLWGIEGGNDTNDKVFLLGLSEVNEYFTSDEARQCKSTAYAKSQGVFVQVSYGSCCYWLRSPGYHQDEASYVSFDGRYKPFSLEVSNNYSSVRPALWINLE